MKILQIINNLGSGGAEKIISELCPFLYKKGYDVEILLINNKNSIYNEELSKIGIKITILSYDKLYSIKHLLKIIYFINKNKFDIVHSHLFPTLYYVSICSLFTRNKTKYIFTEHSNNNRRRNKIYLTLLDRIVYKNYDKIVCISSSVKESLTKHLKYPASKFLIIQNGIDISKFHNKTIFKTNELYKSYSSNHIIITMIGRFSDAKDQKTLIQSLSILPDNYHLILVGEGYKKVELENYCNLLNLENRVHFLGIRTDIPDILKNSDFGVLSSHWEGMPISAIEIMASGIPFIGSKVPGIQDLIESKNDNAGILFEQGNYKEFAGIVEKCIKDNDLYKKIAYACKKRSNDYSMENMANSYIVLYKSLL